MEQYKTPGYVGIIGAVITAIGIFLPFFDMPFFDEWWGEISLAKIMSYNEFTVIVIFAVIILVISAALYYKCEHHSAQVISVTYFLICLVAYFIFLIWLHEIDEELSHYIKYGIGFYAIIIGLVLMNLSPFMPGLNKKIDSLFQN